MAIDFGSCVHMWRTLPHACSLPNTTYLFEIPCLSHWQTNFLFGKWIFFLLPTANLYLNAKLSQCQLRDAVSPLMPAKLILFGDHCLCVENYVDSMPWDFGWTALPAMVSLFLSHRTTLTYLCCISLNSCIIRHTMQYIWWVFTTQRV